MFRGCFFVVPCDAAAALRLPSRALIRRYLSRKCIRALYARQRYRTVNFAVPVSQRAAVSGAAGAPVLARPRNFVRAVGAQSSPSSRSRRRNAACAPAIQRACALVARAGLGGVGTTLAVPSPLRQAAGTPPFRQSRK